MAAPLSDATYGQSGQLWQYRGDKSRPLETPVVVRDNSWNTAILPVPEGMESITQWSYVPMQQSGRVLPEYGNFPCALADITSTTPTVPVSSCFSGCGPYSCNTACANDATDFRLRDAKCGMGSAADFSSASGTGYTTMNSLSPAITSARLGFSVISRIPLTCFNNAEMLKSMGVNPKTGKPWKSGEISQLFLDNKPLLYYFSSCDANSESGIGLAGKPFLFHTDDTVFVFMVPNAIMARTQSGTYRVDIMTEQQRQQTCEDCI